MGANKKSELQKCGELLIDIKKIKYKTKSYTFHCAFCSANCDQLKKFTKHLEEDHMQNFEEDFKFDLEQLEPQCLSILSNQVDVKVEQKIYLEESMDNTITVDKLSCQYLNNDPLKMEKHKSINTVVSNDTMCASVTNDPLKMENLKINGIPDIETKIGSTSVDPESFADDVLSRDDGNEMGHENDKDISDEEENTWNKERRTNTQKLYNNDISSDDTKDSDFTIEKELSHNKRPKKSKKSDMKKTTKYRKEVKKPARKPKETKDESVEKDCNANRKHMRCKRRWKHIDHSLLPVLIEIYKKYEVLWQVKDIAFGVLPKKNEIFGKMFEELKTNHNFDKSLDELQDHIDYLNYVFHKDREQELKCELDKTEFKPSSHFFNELSFLRESQGPFKCSNCNEIIKKYDLYHIHLAQHSGTIPFQCRLCEMGFQKFDNYLRHITRHLGINSYHCNVCGKGYPFKSELDWHLTLHTGVKPYLCPICGASFRARHGYDNHIRRHEKRFRYECHICKHGFNHLCKLNTHIKSHLNIRDVICNVCGKGFTAAKYLHRHKQIHEEEKRYKCNVCGKAFAQDAGLRAHRKQHQPYATVAENKNLLNVFK